MSKLISRILEARLFLNKADIENHQSIELDESSYNPEWHREDADSKDRAVKFLQNRHVERNTKGSHNQLVAATRDAIKTHEHSANMARRDDNKEAESYHTNKVSEHSKLLDSMGSSTKAKPRPEFSSGKYGKGYNLRDDR